MGGDSKINPGSMCTDSYGPGRTVSMGQPVIRYRMDGSVSYKGIQYPAGPPEIFEPFLEVTCPIVRDEIKAKGGGLVSVNIYVTNNDPDSRFSCTVYQKRLGKNISNEHSLNTPVGPYTGVIKFHGYVPEEPDGSPYSFAFFTCRIPKPTAYGESIIHSYETYDTDIE